MPDSSLELAIRSCWMTPSRESGLGLVITSPYDMVYLEGGVIPIN